MSDSGETDADKPQDPVDPIDQRAATFRSSVEDISLDAALSADAKKPDSKVRDKEKEKKFILYGAGGIFALMLIFMVYSCQPQKGSMAYGICSTFLELNTTYPHTLRYISLEGSRTAVRIYFTSIDAFGEFKQETMECKFGPDEVNGMRLTEVLRNRKPVDAKDVAEFNKTLPIVMSSDPYRIAPPDWKNQLLDE